MPTVPATAVRPVPNAPAGKTLTYVDPNSLHPVQGLAPPTPAPAPPVDIFTAAETAIDADRAANAPGATPLGPPPNIAFTDLTTNVPATVNGDAFHGGIADIKSQFIDLTPDNLLVQATTPGAFLNTGSGNDVLIAQGGHNILDGGSGHNVFVGGSGQDTFIQDMTKAGGSATVLNAHAGDSIVLEIGDASNFIQSLDDTPAGLQLTLTGTGALAARTTELVVAGFKVADLGPKFTIGAEINVTNPAHDFLTLHFT